MTPALADRPGTVGAGLEVERVSLCFGDGDQEIRALDEVSLRIGPGEVVAIVGPSGSGKSSLLAVAGGLITPGTGRVVVGDVDLVGLSDRDRTAARRSRIGYVFQHANLLPSLTAREQLLLVAHLAGRISAEHRTRADELLSAVGMAHRADRRPHQLSGGERQRVGIARALMSRPALLLADEPTSALDHERSLRVMAVLAEQAHLRSTATLLATHDADILGYADRVLHMQDGRLS